MWSYWLVLRGRDLLSGAVKWRSTFGRLPVSLSDRFPVGHGLDLERRPIELATGSPGEAGFSKEGLDRAVDILDEAVTSKAFPGGVVVVGRHGKVVLERPFGRLESLTTTVKELEKALQKARELLDEGEYDGAKAAAKSVMQQCNEITDQIRNVT